MSTNGLVCAGETWEGAVSLRLFLLVCWCERKVCCLDSDGMDLQRMEYLHRSFSVNSVRVQIAVSTERIIGKDSIELAKLLFGHGAEV